MSYWLKLTLKILGSFLLLLVLLWLGVAAYVHEHKKDLLAQITAQLNENLNGTLTVESLEPTLIRGLPSISFSLKNVVLRDRLYAAHHHDLLQAKDIYVSIDALSILNRPLRIRNIHINNGKIYLFTDSLGRSNTDIFKKRDTISASTHRTRPSINHIFLKNIDLTFENELKFKLFKMDIGQMETVIHYNDTGWNGSLALETFVKSFAFNTGKGSFIKDKHLSMNIKIGYNKRQEILSIPDQRIFIDKDPISIGGKAFFAETPTAFVLDIKAKGILLKNASALLSPSIASKLDIVDIKRPLDVQANLQGHMKFRDTPTIHINWVVKDNILVTPIGEIADCSFGGMFTNQVTTGAGHNDQNSRISLYRLKGSWQQIPFSADTVNVSDLIHPVIAGRFRSHFPLAKLNPIIGGKTFAFSTGYVSLDLLYKGGILPDDTTASYVYGSLQVSSGTMTYLPRGLKLTNTNARIDLNGNDISIPNVTVTSGNTVLQMNGSVRNFLNVYYTDPSKIEFAWNIRSSKVDLNDFRMFLTPRGSASTVSGTPKRTGKRVPIAQQLDELLAVSSVHMKLQVDRLVYRQFNAADINADIQLERAGIVLNDISLKHAGGRLGLHGSLDQRGAINTFHMVSNIENVHIAEFFRSFENFGQNAITDKNIKGNLYAKVDVTGMIRDDGKLLPKAFNGTVDFDLREAALVDFEPFQKISKYVFRHRNLSNVTFSNIKNKLEINGDRFTIEPLLLESSALNMHIRGAYSLSSGTDMYIDIPLRDPKKDEVILDDSLNLKRAMKGIVIHLKAVNGDDGNVRFQLVGKNAAERTKKKKN